MANEPESRIRDVVDACADCDVCRYLMETNCLFFPELYRLYDREMESGVIISAAELRKLTDLCNFCALCPCPNIRADIMAAKTAYIDRDGLGLNIRILQDVERLGKICGAFPKLSNLLFKKKCTAIYLKNTAGIHKDRKIPEFPVLSFPAWAKKRKLNVKRNDNKRKVAYFAGCTGRYLFPGVPRAAVAVLSQFDIDVYYPEQKCCGMPSMLEGDRYATLKSASYTIDWLADVAGQGYDIVCSCPTCGYLLKEVIKEGAYYSETYQSAVGTDQNSIKLPIPTGVVGSHSRDYISLKKSIYQGILKDEGYFAGIDPQKRIMVSENTYDLGQYLAVLFESGETENKLGPVSTRSIYFPPCHLREQNIGLPYLELLNHIPKLSLEPIQGSFFCCGIAGIMGFKREYHKTSIRMGGRLAAKIKQTNPERIITDCLSCRLQFNQMISYPVYHPVEIIKEALRI